MPADEVARRRLLEAAESVSEPPPPTTEVISAKRRVLRWSLLGVAVLGLAVAVALCYAAFFAAAAVRPFNVPLVSDTASVPNVLGISLGRAKSKLDQAKLKSKVRGNCDEHERLCQVQRQSPPPSVRVERASNVVLWVAVRTGKPACSDRRDNDGDGLIDFGQGPSYDPGCSSSEDNDESDTPPACSDRRDNDGDGLIDFGGDPGCTAADDDDEGNPVPPTETGGDRDQGR